MEIGCPDFWLPGEDSKASQRRRVCYISLCLHHYKLLLLFSKGFNDQVRSSCFHSCYFQTTQTLCISLGYPLNHTYGSLEIYWKKYFSSFISSRKIRLSSKKSGLKIHIKGNLAKVLYQDKICLLSGKNNLFVEIKR